MLRRFIWLFFVVLGIALVFLLDHLSYKYHDYTCHGCMRIETFEQVIQEKALVAVYTCRSSKFPDTLYLTQGLIQGGGYTYYSEGYFIGYTGIMDSAVTVMQAEKILAYFRNGKAVGFSMTSVIPEQIQALNAQNDTLNTFELYRTYPSNIYSGRKVSLLKAWKEILR